MPYKLFPYERRLALRELESLGFCELMEDRTGVTGVGDADVAVHRATYFGTVENGSGSPTPTAQAMVEAAHLELRESSPRQATRYGLHGIHEYKGKFNPQVVRALANVVDLEAEVLVDPFCGSGTSLVEGLRLGMDVVGVDHSPIACFIARAKVAATTTESKAALAEDLLRLATRVANALAAGQVTVVPSHDVAGLTDPAKEYLRRWFTDPAYAALSQALAVLANENGTAGDLARVALSSILRDVSLQLPEDLRIRRRPEPFTAPEMAPLFLSAIDGIRRGLLEMEDWPSLHGRWHVVHGTSESAEAYQAARGFKRRLILTSPPYATALPYIDTDRLSVVALGLNGSKKLATMERSLIGSREWTRSEQLEWEARLATNSDALPNAVTALASRIQEMNGDSAGFRRQAVPSLLYRYFAKMANAFTAWGDVMAPGETAVLIVGHNHTVAGGERVDIATPELLAEVAESRGFILAELIKLETWPRYGLHAANGVPGEDAIVIRRVS
jgi:site-specific DNA-methyltransferase (cytosine-N4-specific)